MGIADIEIISKLYPQSSSSGLERGSDDGMLVRGIVLDLKPSAMPVELRANHTCTWAERWREFNLGDPMIVDFHSDLVRTPPIGEIHRCLPDSKVTQGK